MMEAIYYSETPVLTGAKRRNNPENRILVLIVRIKFINFVFQLLPIFISAMSSGFTSFTFQIIYIFML
jgi:hypothetical protein